MIHRLLGPPRAALLTCGGYSALTIALGAALCASHKHASAFALRSIGAGYAVLAAFEIYVFSTQVFKPAHIAFWVVSFAAFALYFLTAKAGGHHATSSSPARSPARGRGRKST